MHNSVQLIGHIGQDPEHRILENGTAVATFSVATTESWKDKGGEWQQATEWHKVVTWRDLADRAAKLKKGQKVFIEGAIKTREYIDKDLVKRYATEIHATTARSLERAEKQDAFAGLDQAIPPAPRYTVPQLEANPDGLPF